MTQVQFMASMLWLWLLLLPGVFKTYPMAERTILHAGLADLIRVNALELADAE